MWATLSTSSLPPEDFRDHQQVSTPLEKWKFWPFDGHANTVPTVTDISSVLREAIRWKYIYQNLKRRFKNFFF